MRSTDLIASYVASAWRAVWAEENTGIARSSASAFTSTGFRDARAEATTESSSLQNLLPIPLTCRWSTPKSRQRIWQTVKSRPRNGEREKAPQPLRRPWMGSSA